MKNKVPGVCWRKEKKRWVVEHGSNYVCQKEDWFEAVCARKSAEAEYKRLMILSIIGTRIIL